MSRNMKMFFIILLIVIVSVVCSKIFFSQSLPSQRATYYGDVPKSKRLLLGFGDQISHEANFGPSGRENDVKDYLAAGLDPDYCLKMYDGWQFRNPLMLFCSDFLLLSYYEKDYILPNYDVEVFNQLINAGADINKYPYIWANVYLHNDDMIRIFKRDHENSENDVKTFIPCYISDCNRSLKMFLDAGADVNRKGSPVPFEKNICEKISEAKIQKYFNSPDSTSPIYEAIKKGMIWESQVDLLLKYGAILDESCLDAAKLSGDEAMIKKVKTLLELQGK